MVKRFIVIARDRHAPTRSAPVPGLTPTWIHLTDLETGQRFSAEEFPKFEELGGGQYGFSLRLEPGQTLAGVVDMGATLIDGEDRFIDVFVREHKHPHEHIED